MITASTKLICFFADPAEHSGSPAMHNAAFRAAGLDYVYLAFRVGKEDIGRAMDAMRVLGIRGANISMPNKQEVIKYLDSVSDRAELLGAVNTVVNDDGVLKGYNTDVDGVKDAAEILGFPLNGKRVVQIGLGGAGRAALLASAEAGAESVSVFVRARNIGAHREFASMISGEKGLDCEVIDIADKKRLAEELSRSDILLNMTNVGMGSLEGQSPVPYGVAIGPNLSVMDAIYKPDETELIRLAKQAGAAVAANGRTMLACQGAKSFRLFTGQDMPASVFKTLI
ncbi:MAG: shikimate dehydrogenase family protein [Eubacterium sp.]|jgi:shikimate dehydrogenase